MGSFMLQLQNVKKNYKTKGGTVHALDGVSITFPETGLVFITGKSGCGKTTLLNVIGGLDGIDSGEIFIQNKKFSTFSATEYDSYRNTFIGFIFQEYNLLPEFTVEQNIKIAMELQGRKTDDEELEQLLKDVEIDKLKKRFPSELSGGQRQRVAIARALIKQPRIIMADEPTGALDSNTGIQVLDTLKKLSKKTLVIVVSHDREFAEKYADRIIHLENGKVAHDVTFTEKEISDNVSEQGETLIVREGAQLSQTETDVLVKAVKERKAIEIIKKPSFRSKSPTQNVTLSQEQPVSFRKSQMKLKRALQLGVNSLAVKPIRLVITILISALAFAVFGLFDTIAHFSTADILKNQLKIAPSKTVVTTSDYIVDHTAGDIYSVKLSKNTVDGLQNATGGTVKGIANLRDNTTGEIAQSLPIIEITASTVYMGKRYYTNSVSGFVEFDKDTEISADGKFKDFDYTLLCGQYPQLTYLDNTPTKGSVYQIAISSFLADSIIHYLNGNPLHETAITSYESLLGEYITLSQQKYTIVGIIDCGKIPEKYDILAKTTLYNVETNALSLDFNAYIDSTLQKCLFVGNGFLQAVKAENNLAELFYAGNTAWSLSLKDGDMKKNAMSSLYCAENYDQNNILLFDGEYGEDGSATLADDEILIHSIKLEELFTEEIYALPDPHNRSLAKSLIKGLQAGTSQDNKIAIGNLFRLLNIDKDNSTFDLTLSQRFTETGERYEKTLKIAGVYFGLDEATPIMSPLYKLMINKNLMQELKVCPEQGDYSKILFSKQSIKEGGEIIAEYLMSENGVTLNWYNNSILNVITDNEIMIRQAADLFLYAAIALSLFSIFMLYNYISTSIESKTQSMGVLRGLGAGGKDIFLSFLSESFIVSVINGILANIFAVIGCNFVNGYIVEIMNISVHFALFGIRQVFIILIISLLTAILSSSFPIFKISQKKPVELIRRS